MRKPTPSDRLTEKEEELMRLLWEYGPLPVSKLVELYPEPQPHFNTVATVMRRLEAKGFAAHTEEGGTFVYHAATAFDSFRKRSFGEFIRSYFKNSYFGAVSALVADEKISADELRELLELVEQKSREANPAAGSHASSGAVKDSKAE